LFGKGKESTQSDVERFDIYTPIYVGEDGTGYDVKLFGATSGKYWLWDESADKMIVYGGVEVGVDDTGHDVKFFGATASAYLLWDESEDALVTGGVGHLHLSGIDADAGEGVGSVIQMGTSGTPLTSAEDETELISCYADSTGKNIYGMRIQVTKTSVSAGAPRGLTIRAELGHTTGNGPQGANAVDARATLDKLGGTGISGEMHAMESQCRVEDTTRTVQGTYAAHKFVNNFQTGNTMPAATTFFVRFRDEGSVKTPYLFEISGTTQGSGNMFDSTANLTNPQIDHTLKINIAGTAYYIPLMDNANGS